MQTGNKKNPKEMVPVHLETFVLAVNEAIPLFIFNVSQDLSYSFYKKMHNKNVLPEVKSEKIAQCNMRVELQEAALQSIMRDTAEDKYPDYPAIQSVLNHVLNDPKYSDFRYTSEALSRLLHFHSPSRKDMNEYYLHIIQDKFASVSDDGLEENQPFLTLVVETIRNNSSHMSEKFAYPTYPPIPEEVSTDQLLESANLAMLKTKTKQSKNPCNKTIEPGDKLNRSIFCLGFVCDILEQNLVVWLQKSPTIRWKPTSRPLLAQYLWPDVRREGHISHFIQKLIALQKHTINNEMVTNHSCARLMTLTAELLRAYDRLEHQRYPFVGTLSLDLAREIAVNVTEEINSGNDRAAVHYLTRLKPTWLRMLVASRVLGTMAGFQCDPELQSVIIVMEHLEQIYKIGRRETRMKERREVPQADETIVARFSKLKSVNTLFKNGMGRLHTACKENDVAAVRALLTFPCLNLNLKNDRGWTALHVAASKGNVECVEELLNYAPKVGDVQRRVDTRSKGPAGATPLMQAVLNAHLPICTLLLQHTGSVLLEDITDDNETVLDLCKDENIRKLLQLYKAKKVETIYSKKEMYLATGNLVLIAELCSNLLQSYMAVHRTWDVYHALKKHSKSPTETKSNPQVLCEYSRYHRDFKTNLPKLREMVMKLRKVKELSSINDIFLSIVSLNKT